MFPSKFLSSPPAQIQRGQVGHVQSFYATEIGQRYRSRRVGGFGLFLYLPVCCSECQPETPPIPDELQGQKDLGFNLSSTADELCDPRQWPDSLHLFFMLCLFVLLFFGQGSYPGALNH